MLNRLALGATFAVIAIGAHANMVGSGSMATTDTVGIARFEPEPEGSGAGPIKLAATDPGPGSSAVDPPTIANPEPETIALMLTGLGLLGFIARRRVRK